MNFDFLYFDLPQKPFKNEPSFLTWFGKQVKKQGWHYHKISDLDIRMKYYDAFLLKDGFFFAIEGKVTQNKTCKPYRMLRGSSASKPGIQVKGLEKAIENGGNSIIIIYNKNLNIYRIVNFNGLGPDDKIDFKK